MKISIVTPAFNEEGNVVELCERISTAMASTGLDYEHIIIDNASTDCTVDRVKEVIARDKRVKLIVNTRNFGHIRSPAHGFLTASGDAVIGMASDLQDPPELIPSFIERWRRGAKIVLGVKETSEESLAMWLARRVFYRLLDLLSEVKPVRDATGFGLYDRSVMDLFRQTRDPYPFFRGFLAETGYAIYRIPYRQPVRKHGFTKNNFLTLYDYAMLAFVNHSKLPLRFASLLGFLGSAASLAVGVLYLIFKLAAWHEFELGIAPVIIGLFFLGSVQLLFLGVVGEYIGFIFTRIKNESLVVERERVNFEDRQ
ncbi:MAG: glycosyltransferase [Betaproteobacteria bacterium]|nr:MAG: glycosyltransferase [Betaproteobacteria bacterium]